MGPKIETSKIYEQTKKFAISEEITGIFFPCYFLLDGFYLKSLLFIFRITQIILEIFGTIQAKLNSRKTFIATAYGTEER
ncbi:MAG TPA: hypothetical protein HA306_05640 [Methanosarcina sp.]|nr:hypothetical protein [Methanosarcina sp.]